MTEECIGCGATESRQWYLLNMHDITLDYCCATCWEKMWDDAFKDIDEHNAWVDTIEKEGK
jgi:predicted SAM-dependent methyltransferase